MGQVWWRAEPHDLHRVSDRVSSLYVERTHVDRDENAVILINKERTVRVPAALVTVLLLGPGTRVTHAAMNLLGDSGTAVCWVGEHGVRMYAGGLGPSRGAHLLLRQAWLVSRVPERLGVARQMYARRFPNEDVSSLTTQQLRGREGARVKRLYREHAKRTGVEWAGRRYKHGDPFAEGDDVNRLLSAGNSCLYGICHAAIVGLGASPGLGFVHTGSASSFVMDIADLYKADTTIPLAFELASLGRVEERDMRLAFRDRLTDGRLLHRIINDVRDVLGGEDPDDSRDRNQLWDPAVGAVDGGVDWSRDAERSAQHPSHQVVTGPDLTALPPESPT
jgi:CRISPR-associated protein Cas1